MNWIIGWLNGLAFIVVSIALPWAVLILLGLYCCGCATNPRTERNYEVHIYQPSGPVEILVGVDKEMKLEGTVKAK